MHTLIEQTVSVHCRAAPGFLAHLQWLLRWRLSCRRQKGCCSQRLQDDPRTQLLRLLSSCSAAHRTIVLGICSLAQTDTGSSSDSIQASGNGDMTLCYLKQGVVLS